MYFTALHKYKRQATIQILWVCLHLILKITHGISSNHEIEEKKLESCSNCDWKHSIFNHYRWVINGLIIVVIFHFSWILFCGAFDDGKKHITITIGIRIRDPIRKKREKHQWRVLIFINKKEKENTYQSR